MFEKELRGIHLTDRNIHVSAFKRGFKGWQRVPSAEGIIAPAAAGSGLDRLEALLARMRPQRSRHIYLTIPQKKVYLRELSFPSLSLEDAAESARLSLSIHCHLPPDEIYFDLMAFERNGQSTVLLAYVRRNIVDNIVTAFKKTGHFRSLKAVCPLGQGVDLLLRLGSSVSFPCVSLVNDEGESVLCLHGRRCWQGAHCLDSGGTEDPARELEGILRLLPAPFRSGSLKGYLFGRKRAAPFELEDPLKDPGIKEVVNLTPREDQGERRWNPGWAAAALGLSPHGYINLLPGKKAGRRRSRISLLKASAAAAAAAACAMTIFYGGQTIWLYSKFKGNETKIEELEKGLEPYSSVQARMEKVQKTRVLVEEFLAEGPPVLDVIKELALRIPREAWVRNCSMRLDRIRLSMEGGSAVQVMEALKKSPLFKEVNIISSVTRTKDQQERYTLEIKLKRRRA